MIELYHNGQDMTDIEKEDAGRRLDLINSKINAGTEINKKAYNDYISSENNIEDFMVRYKDIHFMINIDTISETKQDITLSVRIPYSNIEFRIHDNAISQLLEKLDVPVKFYSKLKEKSTRWGLDLIARILNDLVTNTRHNESTLIRTNGSYIMAVLSSSYDRYSSSKVFNDALISFKDMVHVKSFKTNNITAWLDIISRKMITIRINGLLHYYIIGAHIRNSSYGVSALEIRPYILNVVCSNGLIRTSIVYDEHRRKPVKEIGILSKETLELTAALKVSRTKDALTYIFGTMFQEEEMGRLLTLSMTMIDTESELGKIAKQIKLSKAETNTILEIISGGSYEHGLIGNGSAYDIMQAMTVYAQSPVLSIDRSYELMEAAGNIVIVGK